MSAKLAVTEPAALIVTRQEPVPEQAPLQPEKADPAAGVAARGTSVAARELAGQVAPPTIGAGGGGAGARALPPLPPPGTEFVGRAPHRPAADPRPAHP